MAAVFNRHGRTSIPVAFSSLASLHDSATSQHMTSSLVALIILLSAILLFAALWAFTQRKLNSALKESRKNIPFFPELPYGSSGKIISVIKRAA
jgi:hypothetical protein